MTRNELFKAGWVRRWCRDRNCRSCKLDREAYRRRMSVAFASSGDTASRVLDWTRGMMAQWNATRATRAKQRTVAR